MNGAENETGSEEVTEAELIHEVIESEMLDHFHAVPARVDSFDWNNGSPIVKVTPLLKRRLPDGAGGYTPEELPQLQDVPVKFYRCGDFVFVFPLKAGDQGVIFFADHNLGTWRATGDVSDPGDIRRHGLDGAFFVPGLFDDKHPAQTDPGNNMIIGRDGVASAQIEITGAEIHLGAGASKQAARKGDRLSAGAALAAWASIVETFVNGVAPGTFNAGNQWAGANPSNPGAPNALGSVNEGSAHTKVGD